MSLNIVFAGTPEFAVPVLLQLLGSKHKVCAVYTQPDRPAGRGRQLTPSAIKRVALENQLPIFQPLSLRDTAEQQKLRDLHPDIMIVVAYGLILPQSILDIPSLGCINVHASLLPRWRGAAPIQRAILAGDVETGITIMQMEAGLDTGPMLKKQICIINQNETSQTLHDRLSVMGAELLLGTLTEIENKTVVAVPQENTKATYAEKLTKEEARLNWEESVEILARKVRAFNPWPIAFTYLHAQPLRIWQALPIMQPHNFLPGTIMTASKEGIDVAANNGFLRILQLQMPGGKVQSAQEFLNARKDLIEVKKTRLGSL